MAGLSDLLRGGAPSVIPQGDIVTADVGMPGGLGAFLKAEPMAAPGLEPSMLPHSQGMPLDGDAGVTMPPKLSTALRGVELPPSPKPSVKGGSRANHDWNGKAGRWQAPDGKFLSGPPPKGAKGKP